MSFFIVQSLQLAKLDNFCLIWIKKWSGLLEKNNVTKKRGTLESSSFLKKVYFN